MKLLSKLGLLLIVAVLFAACVAVAPQQAPEQAEQPSAPVAEEVVEVRVGNAPPEEDTAARSRFMSQIELFEESHPGIKIVPDTWTWNPQEFAARLAAGEATDVIVVPATEGHVLIDRGYAADITEKMQNWQVGRDFNEAILAPYSREGKLYAVPSHGYAMGLFYDKPLFVQAGLVDENGEAKPPTTWDEFVEAAVTVKENTDAAGFCMFTKGNQGGWTFINWGWQAGGEFERQVDGKWEATFDEPPIVEAMQFIKDLRWEYDVLQDELLLDAGQSFPLAATHQCGMAMYAPEWFDIVVTQHGGKLEDLGMTILPAGPAGHVNQMGGVYSVINASASPAVQDAAFQWITWNSFDLAAMENDMKNRQETGALVGLPSIPKYKAGSATFEQEQALIAQYRNVPEYATYVQEAGQYVRPEPPVATQDLYATLDTVIQTVLTDQNADPQALLTQAASEFQTKYLDPANQ